MSEVGALLSSALPAQMVGGRKFQGSECHPLGSVQEKLQSEASSGGALRSLSAHAGP